MSISALSGPASLLPAESNPLLLDQFLAPLQPLFAGYLRGIRTGSVLNDVTFAHRGIQRVLSQSVSGRDFLQHLAEVHDTPLARSTFFDALQSGRREQLLGNLNSELVRFNTSSLPDLLGAFPALANCPVYAVDGHHVAHAVHANRHPDGDHVTANNLYLLGLHDGLLQNIGAVQGGGKRRHEMPVLREQILEWLLRQGPGRGPVPILVLDPAFIDNAFWIRMAMTSASRLRFVTRLKKNMKPMVLQVRTWDLNDTINQGVQTDEKVSFNGRDPMRLIRYLDPETGYLYEFLTTVMDLPPGLVAFLYLMRWRIEKVFDTSKNKLQEKKSWATGSVAQNIQTHLIALTHNLLVIFREKLRRDHGIQEVKIERKRQKAIEVRREAAVKVGRLLPSFHDLVPTVIQLSAQYIRVLRNGILTSRRWLDSLRSFRRAMEIYL